MTWERFLLDILKTLIFAGAAIIIAKIAISRFEGAITEKILTRITKIWGRDWGVELANELSTETLKSQDLAGAKSNLVSAFWLGLSFMYGTLGVTVEGNDDLNRKALENASKFAKGLGLKEVAAEIEGITDSRKLYLQEGSELFARRANEIRDKLSRELSKLRQENVL